MSDNMIGERIDCDANVIQKMIAKNSHDNHASIDTYLFHVDIISNGTIVGFSMFQYFKKHALEGHKNFWQILTKNLVFVA